MDTIRIPWILYLGIIIYFINDMIIYQTVSMVTTAAHSWTVRVFIMRSSMLVSSLYFMCLS